MAKKSVAVDLDLLFNKIRNAIYVSALEKSKLSLDDNIARLSFVNLLQESNVALALEEFNIYCRDNLGRDVFVNGLNGTLDIGATDGINIGTASQLFISAGGLDITSDNNISIVAQSQDVVIQSSSDAVIIDGALGITLFNGGSSNPVRSEPQIVVGSSVLNALNAWINARNGSVSRASLYVEPQVNYTGANQAGLLWNSSVSRSFIEQQVIGNKIISGVLGASTGSSNTVGNTGVPTNITGTGYTYTLPINSLVVGKRLRVTFRGRYSTGVGTPQVNIRLQAGSNTVKLVNVQLQPSQTNRGFHGEAFMTFTVIGVGGRVNASINASFDSSNGILSGGINPNISYSNYNTTIAQSISFNWAWVNNTAQSSVTFEDVIFEVLN